MLNEARYVATDASQDGHHARKQCKVDARRHSSNTETTFVSDPEAPAASVTVTVTVKLVGIRTTYVWLTVNEPWLVLLPVLVEPSPQLIVYDHGPLPLASVKLTLVE